MSKENHSELLESQRGRATAKQENITTKATKNTKKESLFVVNFFAEKIFEVKIFEVRIMKSK